MPVSGLVPKVAVRPIWGSEAEWLLLEPIPGSGDDRRLLSHSGHAEPLRSSARKRPGIGVYSDVQKG